VLSNDGAQIFVNKASVFNDFTKDHAPTCAAPTARRAPAAGRRRELCPQDNARSLLLSQLSGWRGAAREQSPLAVRDKQADPRPDLTANLCNLAILRTTTFLPRYWNTVKLLTKKKLLVAGTNIIAAKVRTCDGQD
jgi:ribosome modulation factor